MKFIIGILLLLFAQGANAQGQYAKGQKALIVYYSWSGNTRTVAQKIQAATGADLFEIRLVNEYPAEYRQVVERFRQEKNSRNWPALKEKVNNLGQYDVIFIGSPNWGRSIAPPVSSFLTSHDLQGKKIVPFMTHGGGGWGQSREDMKTLCPKSEFLEGLALNGDHAATADTSITRWLQRLGFTSDK